MKTSDMWCFSGPEVSLVERVPYKDVLSPAHLEGRVILKKNEAVSLPSTCRTEGGALETTQSREVSTQVRGIAASIDSQIEWLARPSSPVESVAKTSEQKTTQPGRNCLAPLPLFPAQAWTLQKS